MAEQKSSRWEGEYKPLYDPETGFTYVCYWVIQWSGGETIEYFADSYRGVAVWTSSLHGTPDQPPAKLFSTAKAADAICWRLEKGWLRPQCEADALQIVGVVRKFKSVP